MTSPSELAPGMVLRGIVLVTGTGTGVGKTMATAALAGAALAAGLRVCVVKPVQTGVGPGEPGDIAEVARLLGGFAPGGLAVGGFAPGGVAPEGLAVEAAARLTLHEFFRLPDPLAPQGAALRAGVRLPALAEHAEQIRTLSTGADLVLVEGAGGLLVRLEGDDPDGGTLAELAALLPGLTGTVIVTGAELGTLNVTELTVEALRRRNVPIIALVIGCWPADPGPAELDNRRDLPRLTGVPLLGLIPEAPALPPRLLPA
jgi:dethiobiotin synthetase